MEALGLITVVALGVLFFIRRNNKERKENLNIVKDENMLKFYLSDDKFFSINLDENRNLSYTLIKTVRKEIESFKENVRKIDFINFEDKALEDKLNTMLKKAQEKN